MTADAAAEDAVVELGRESCGSRESRDAERGHGCLGAIALLSRQTVWPARREKVDLKWKMNFFVVWAQFEDQPFSVSQSLLPAGLVLRTPARKARANAYAHLSGAQSPELGGEEPLCRQQGF